jgi:hypothetical protein
VNNVWGLQKDQAMADAIAAARAVVVNMHNRAEKDAAIDVADEGEGALTGRLEMHRARTWSALNAVVLAIGVVSPVARADDINDYPTRARADYVFGCMKANGESQRSLEQCSCSIDVIASLISYDRYVGAETVLRMAQVQGNLGGQFRSTEQARTLVDDLRRAQAEAEVRCF